MNYKKFWRKADEIATERLIESYTKLGVRRDKIKFVSGTPCFQFGEDAYQCWSYPAVDVDKINDSEGIVICSAIYDDLYKWRYAYVKSQSISLTITKADIENKIGYPINDMKLEPLYDNGTCVGLDVTVRPKTAVEHIELNVKDDLKYVCMYYSNSYGVISVYESDSMGVKQCGIGGAMNWPEAGKLATDSFPEYEIVDGSGEGIKRMLTLRRKAKEPDDLKYACALYSRIGPLSVYMCDSTWSVRAKIGIASTIGEADKCATDNFLGYSIVDVADDGIQRKLTLSRKPKEPDWRVGSYYFQKTGGRCPITWQDLYTLQSFEMGTLSCSYTFDDQWQIFVKHFDNGLGFDYNKIDGIAYYKPRL